MNTMLLSVYVMIKSMFSQEEGQDLIEYALIIALFVLVAVAGIAAMAGPLQAMWGTIAGSLGA
jgi:pilus assembly protein Flp/PilA